MKIIHCADIHLDSKMSTNLTIDKAIERNKEICNTFKRMVEYAQNCGASAILISGDMFDTAKVTHRTRDYISDIIANTPDIKFLYLRGNHDSTEKLSCNTPNLVAMDTYWKYVNIDNVVIAGIEMTRDNCYNYYDSLKLEEDKVNIVMLHGDIRDNVSGYELINIAKLQNKNIDYLALGHIHDHNSGELDDRGQWVFSGCLEGRGFDECGPKGFIEIEVFEHSLTWKFVPFARREITEVFVDITGAKVYLDIENRVVNAVKDLSKDTILRVVLTGKYDISLRKDNKQLVSTLNNLFYSFRVKDSSRLYIDPKTYEKDISLKGEFIRSIMKLDIADEQKDAMIVIGIQALSGEDIIL